MKNAQDFFIQEAIAHARSMAVPDAVLFLSGLLMSCQDNNAFTPVRAAFITLSESDRQLDLIQTGQLKLNFTTINPTQP